MYEAALELYADMLPVVRQHLASSPTAKVCLTGHSLGGALASLLMLMLVWRGDVPPGRLSPCFTFGAPAAFCDKEEGGSGVGVLERLGLSGSSLVNVVMHLDVVPRIFVCDYTATVSHALMGGIVGCRGVVWAAGESAGCRVRASSCIHIIVNQACVPAPISVCP